MSGYIPAGCRPHDARTFKYGDRVTVRSSGERGIVRETEAFTNGTMYEVFFSDSTWRYYYSDEIELMFRVLEGGLK